jgi:glycosyltransferase involved in cell wall biosynthesis
MYKKLNITQLIITPSFVPIDSSTTLINAKIIQALEVKHVDSIVVTIEPSDTLLNSTPLLSDIFHTNSKIIRIRSFEKGNRCIVNLRKMLIRIFPVLFYIPDYHFIWQLLAIVKIFFIKRKLKFNIIHSISAPYSSHIVGLFAKLIYKLPWICHLDDFWVDQPREHFDRYRFINVWLERLCFQNADCILFSSKEIMSYASKRYSLTIKNKFLFIPPAYIPEHYPEVKIPTLKKYIFNYLGNFYPGLRDPESLLRAVKLIAEKYPTIYEIIEINLIGNNTKKYELNVRQLGLDNVINCLNPVDYLNSAKKMKEATVLLHIGGNVGQGKFSQDVYISGKMFEYVGAEKIIFSLTTKSGPVADFVRRCNGIVCNYYSPEDIATKMCELVRQFSLDELYSWKNPKSMMAKYHIETVVSSYLGLFKSIVYASYK